MSVVAWFTGARRRRELEAIRRDNEFKLAQQKRWSEIHQLVKEGWLPCIINGTEYAVVPCLADQLAQDRPGDYERIELRRLGEEHAVVAKWDDLPEAMNVTDLWWRPVKEAGGDE